MTLDPFLDLQAALLTYLRGQESLSLWLGSPPRVYDQPPTQPIYPFITLGRAAAQSIGGLGPEVTEQTLNLMCLSRFGGAEEAKAIAAELRLLLDAASLSLSDQHLVSLRVSYIDVFRAADQRTTYAIVRIRAVSEPI